MIIGECWDLEIKNIRINMEKCFSRRRKRGKTKREQNLFLKKTNDNFFCAEAVPRRA